MNIFNSFDDKKKTRKEKNVNIYIKKLIEECFKTLMSYK